MTVWKMGLFKNPKQTLGDIVAGHENENKNENGKDSKNLYQDSLNLPRTDFSIRANLQAKEPEMLKRWQAEDLYTKATVK